MDPDALPKREKARSPRKFLTLGSWAGLRRFWNRRRRAYLFASCATYVAVILAVLPPIINKRLRSPEFYDPTVAVLTATLVALIWTAYHTFQGVQHARLVLENEENKRARDARFFLEALAEEMDHLDRSLSIIEKMPSLARFDYLSHPILNDCLKRSDLFSPATAARMANVASTLRPLPDVLRAYRPDPKDPEFNKTVIEIIKKSHSSLRSLARNLVDVLEGEGPFAAQSIGLNAVTIRKEPEPPEKIPSTTDPATRSTLDSST